MAKRALRYGNLNKRLDTAVTAWLEKNLADLVRVYKDIHSHPELSTQEKRTAGIIAERFRESGLKVTENVGGYGVAGVLANGSGPVVLVRADMDALPVTEGTGLPYASKTLGVMHACGHDVHATAITGIAAAMQKAKNRWGGTLVFVAQPAEELGAGAREMVEDGLFKRVPRPGVCLALHVEAQMPLGQLGLTSGWAAANVDSVDVTIFGKGGHGASPHEAADPIVAAAHFITALQTIVTRRINPLEPVVITVGSIHAGQKHNIIPDRADLQLTVRTYSDEVREKVLSALKSVARDSARAAGCAKAPRVKTGVEHVGSVYNDPDLSDHAAGLFGELVGAKNVVPRPQTMGGEDFSVYPRELGVPGLIYEVGAVRKTVLAEAQRQGRPAPPLHSSGFAPVPSPTLRLAVRSMCALAGSILAKK